MKKHVKYFLLSFILIFLSTPLGYKTVDVIYFNRNLSGEYVTILNGFIHSFMLIGFLIFIMGLMDVLSNKNKL